MADPQVLGDYDPELVTLSLSGIKSGEEIVPSQYAPDSRISIGERARSESIEGMGGSVVRARLHTTLTTLTITLMPSDPANRTFSSLVDTGEVFDVQIKDNSAENSKVQGRCWFSTSAGYNKNRTAEPMTWSFEIQVKAGAMQHGSTSLV